MLEYWENMMSICSGIGTIAKTYSTVSGIWKTDKTENIENYLKQIVEDGIKIQREPERLSDHILYAQNFSSVQDVTKNKQQYIKDLRDVKEYLQPVQSAIGGTILSSAMIWTPERMQQAMNKSPWETLNDIRPIQAVYNPHPNPDMVPVLFEFDQQQYLGWQFNNILKTTFECEYNKLLIPNSNSEGSLINQSHGEGKMDYPNGTPEVPDARTYEGELHNGKPHGRGIMVFADGGTLDGYWNNGYYNP